MTTSNDFKNGMVIKLDGTLFTVVEFMHVKPGKGGAFVRSKLKNLLTGAVIDKTFRGGEKVEDVIVERRDLEYSYHDGTHFVFMDMSDYEQFMLDEALIGDTANYIKEGVQITGYFYEGSIIMVEPPIHVSLMVKETQPGIKGNTVSGGSKPATLETGLVVTVPLFINEGDELKIDTRTNTYVERV